MNEQLHLAIACCIQAAGFDALAAQYDREPAQRVRILAQPWLRRELELTVGAARAARFFEIAQRSTPT